MPIRLGNRFRHFISPVMFSRCLSSLYRSVRANKSFLSIRRYHLLPNAETLQPRHLALSNIIREIAHTFGLSLFLFYLFYQLFGNFILIICLVCGILCKSLCNYNRGMPEAKAKDWITSIDLDHSSYLTNNHLVFLTSLSIERHFQSRTTIEEMWGAELDPCLVVL